MRKGKGEKREVEERESRKSQKCIRERNNIQQLKKKMDEELKI
ncbi:hypothetical protein [Staphylococcus aureus]|nr:hypothetical protein [Staphylococcus aureus]